VFLRKEKFPHGILLDVVMFNMWMRTERKKNTSFTKTTLENLLTYIPYILGIIKIS